MKPKPKPKVERPDVDIEVLRNDNDDRLACFQKDDYIKVMGYIIRLENYDCEER